MKITIVSLAVHVQDITVISHVTEMIPLCNHSIIIIIILVISHMYSTVLILCTYMGEYLQLLPIHTSWACSGC